MMALSLIAYHNLGITLNSINNSQNEAKVDVSCDWPYGAQSACVSFSINLNLLSEYLSIGSNTLLYDVFEA